jgi:hypothetical protein
MGIGLNAMLEEIRENKRRCVFDQNFQEAVEWRNKEVEFMKTYFNEDIENNDDPEMFKQLDFIETIILKNMILLKQWQKI